jgi:hypothetical protein
MVPVGTELVEHSSHEPEEIGGDLLSDPNPLLRIGSRAAARRFITEISGEPDDELLSRAPDADFRYSTYGHGEVSRSSVA